MELNEIAGALAAAQAEMANPSFDSTNPHFKSKFASLAAVRNTVVPVLAKHGISVCQDLRTVEGGVACTTILTHKSGQQMQFGPLVMPATKQDAQGFGSAGTYARRYSLMAVAGVVGDDDDDANSATGKPAPAIKANGWTDGSGRPDTAHVDPELAQQYADSMKSIMDAKDPNRAWNLHSELVRDQALYTAAGDLAGRKALWKELIAAAKKKEAA